VFGEEVVDRVSVVLEPSYAEFELGIACHPVTVCGLKITSQRDRRVCG
jgi:hypothetical protein